MASAKELGNLYRDESLAELQERLKIGDGLLDVIDLVENQHSAIIGWMFDPREGHGQGDSILRDFLSHISDQATKRWSKGISLRTAATQGFARNWTVQRLQTASLGAAFAATEFSSTATNRLDLIVIDPENQYLIAIENKISRFKPDQLKRYRDFVVQLQKKTPSLRNFKVAFVALARDFDPDDEEKFTPALRKELTHWIPTNYDWLKAGARRAELNIQRGNAAAKLVQDYCQRQTGWQSPNDLECAKLVARIWSLHPAAAADVCASGRRPQKAWVLGKVSMADTGASAQLFAAQNGAVVNALMDGRGFNSVRQRLLQMNEHFKDELVNYGRTWLDVMPRGVQPIYDSNNSEYFPVFLNAYRISDTAARVRLLFRPGCIEGNATEDQVRSILTSFNPEFNKLKNYNRRVVLKESVNNDDLAAYMAKLEEQLTLLFEKGLSVDKG